MSLFTLFCLILSSTFVALSLTMDPSGTWDLALKGGAVLFGILFLASLLVGRKIKFDPVLR
ncbi:PA3371 family protein [Stutzerimonas marianensis]|uniref:PA3371 family protein n=1 Tax=Stutzerimonas marianensis TaxID=2929513 RepID=UPI003C304564